MLIHAHEAPFSVCGDLPTAEFEELEPSNEFTLVCTTDFCLRCFGMAGRCHLPDIVWLDQLTQLLRTAFFSALKMVIAPLIFFSLIAGVMQLRASRQMGRLGSVTIAYYLTTTGIAVCIGLVIVLFYHPWTAFRTLIEDASVLGDVTAQSARLIDPGDGSTFSLLNNLLQRMLINPFNALSEMNVSGHFGRRNFHWPGRCHDPAGRFIGPQNFRRTCPGDLQTGGLGTDHSAHWSVRHHLPTGTKNRFFHPLAALGQLAGVVFAATLFHGLIVLPAIAWLGPT